ncbi:MAG: hypothetical protein D3910_00810 [Candidatus Electrothrix sp. ATG2]|nr:hypothetical protein [Candidatus Electrothrix sp. ATG2]
MTAGWGFGGLKNLLDRYGNTFHSNLWIGDSRSAGSCGDDRGFLFFLLWSFLFHSLFNKGVRQLDLGGLGLLEADF